MADEIQEVKRGRGRPVKPGIAVQHKRPSPARVEIPDFLNDDDDDRLHIDKDLIPDGMSYQWVTDAIFGQPQPQRRARFERKGWAPVPATRHDGLFTPKGYVGEINVDGLVLMERPKEYTEYARNKETKKARDQVMVKEQQLYQGDINVSLDSHHKTAVRQNRINKSYERLDIPED